MPLKPIAIVIALLALAAAVWLLVAAARPRRRWLGLLVRGTPALLLLALVASLGSYIFGFSGPHPFFNRAAPVAASTTIYYLDYFIDFQTHRHTTTLIAIEGQTGKTLWQRPMTSANRVAFVPGADAVYVVTSSYSSPGSSPPGSVISQLFALSATTGSIRWQETLQNAVGYSPVLAQGALYLIVTLPNPSSGQQLVALRPSDGSRLWAAPIESAPLTSTFLLSATNDTLIIRFGDAGYQARSMTDGKLLWSDNAIDAFVLPSAGAVYAFPSIGPLVARDAHTGVMLWQFGGDNDDFHAGVVSGDTLFVTMRHADPAGPGNGTITNPETVYALDAANGRLRWRFATQSQDAGTLIASRDTVYIKADDGAHALRATDGAVRWSNPHSNWTFDNSSAQPAVVSHTLYVTSLQTPPPDTISVFSPEKAQNFLYAVNEADGSADWGVALDPVITFAPHFFT
ncbi:MAG TPA: PQQ-binding-like beta-propeller repeat protein [Ktedonobacterales bacterium]|nr:PQQ-binding-like beta-propeller repeat protein [Ktedonobacterales bacterium]